MRWFAHMSTRGLGCVFAENVALEGGQHFDLRWLLTRFGDPPFARLADPRGLTA